VSLDPKSLRLFIRAVELGTISAAAELEHIAPAAVSRRIGELERTMGTALVTRSNKGLAPTVPGKALIDLSRRLLHDLDALQSQVRDYARGTRGPVRVLANISSITQFLPSELRAFLTAHPDVEVRLEENVSSAIARAVEANEADVGLIVRGTAPLQIECRPYRQDTVCVIVPARHPLAPRKSVRFAETLAFDYVGLPTGSQLNLQLVRAASELDRSWRCRVQVASYDALCLMVEAGMGIGVLPLRLAQSHQKALRIKILELREPWVHRVLAVCFRSYAAASPAARLLIDHLLRSSPSEGREVITTRGQRAF
jgi:DNA-binding transcriptional LysR family regulator